MVKESTMPQVIDLGRSRNDELREQLSASLGKNLSSFMGSYAANRKLDDLVNREDFKKAPLSEKMNLLQSSMGAYGEIGQHVMKQRLQSELQRQQEQQQSALTKYLTGQQLSPEEEQQVPGEARLRQRQLDVLEDKNKAAGKKLQDDFNKKELEKQEDLKLADQMAIDSGRPELAGKGYPTKLMATLVKPEKKEPLSIFDKKRQEAYSKEFLDLEKTIPELRHQVENLDSLDTLIDKVSGITGYSKAATGHQDAAELEAKGYAAIAPMIKLFNPAGPLAQTKLEQLKRVYAFSPWERSSKLKAKKKVLKLFATQALERANQRKQLIESYLKGKSTDEQINQFDKESETMLDAMIAYPFEGKEETGEKTQQTKIRVKNKKTGQKGMITPYEGMEAYYERA